MTERNQPALRLVTLNGRRLTTRTRITPPTARMHRKKVVGAQLLAFQLQRSNQRRPSVVRDSLPLLPLTDGPLMFTNVVSHFRDGLPAGENVVEGLHGPHCASDELSGQVPPTIPMTRNAAKRTMRPMGRGVTPVKVRAAMAEKLYAARVTAGYETQQQAATAIGVGLDRYRKWESGRTPVPAQYVPVVCDIFGVDANYLFSVVARAARRVA